MYFFLVFKCIVRVGFIEGKNIFDFFVGENIS